MMVDMQQLSIMKILLTVSANVSHGETAQDRDSALGPCGIEDLL